jgi:hypothetical protein
MNVEQIFSFASMLALLGWAALVLSLFVPAFRAPARAVARWVVPLILAVLYAALIAGFFASAEGGYQSLAAVRALFATPEILLAGWIHYLAFDLLAGTLIAEHGLRHGVPRLLLVPILGLTFLFGPTGLLAFAALLGLTGLATPKAGAGEPA